MIEQSSYGTKVRDQLDAIELVAGHGVRLVDLVFSDIAGGAKALTIPVSLLERTLEHGYRFDGSALTGGLRLVELDLYLVPDPSTLLMLPEHGATGSRARFCCSVMRRDGQAFDGDPRSVLERALLHARQTGFDYRVAVEMEFYLLPDGSFEDARLPGEAGYFDTTVDAASRTRDDLLSTLQTIGIQIGGAHHETGPGQQELDLLPVDALQMADQLMSVRQIIRSIAQEYGLRATFMPKPFTDLPGSGLHIFQRLNATEDGRDAFKEPNGGLSGTAYNAIAGQLNHAPGLSIVLNPTVNSYKRLNAGHRAPRFSTWAQMSQSSLIRVPSFSAEEDAALELRSPDSLANPYLALAAALTAMLDGIRNQDEPPDSFEEGLSSFDDAAMQRIGVPRLPGTLGEALIAAAQDPVVQAALGSYIYEQMVTVKRSEWEEYRAHVGAWEHRRYGDA